MGEEMKKQAKRTPETLEVIRGAPERVEANDVVLRQAGARSIDAESVSVRQGGIVQAQTERLDMLQGAVVLAQTWEARMTASDAGLVCAGGPVTMDQSGAMALLAREAVTMDQSGVVLMMAPEVHADEANAVFLLARRVDGDVHAVFGPRESLLFGAAAGAAVGLGFLLIRGLRGRRDHH